MPARRRKNQFKSKYKSKPKFKKLIFILAVVSVVGAAFLLLVLAWAGSVSRISTVSQAENRDVVFSLFDFKGGSISIVTVPGDTQVSVARSLGSWKINSVWKLGENEKIGGKKLLAETVTKSLKMPVTTQNLGLVEKIRIEILKFNLRSSRTADINLADTGYLIKTKLSDGSLGYKVSDGDLPFELKVILADADVSKENSNILLENLSGKSYVESVVSGIVEVLGGKVASIAKGEVKDIDCAVYGESKLVSYQVISRVFACARGGKLNNYNFDVVLRIGTSFTGRF